MVTKAIHFGGGNIGRGFVAEKLSLTGYEVQSRPRITSQPQYKRLTTIQVIFVDVVDSLIEQLQNTKSYTVTEIGTEGTKENTITNYRAINSKTHEADVVKEISEADVVSKIPNNYNPTFRAHNNRSPVPSAPTSSNSSPR